MTLSQFLKIYEREKISTPAKKNTSLKNEFCLYLWAGMEGQDDEVVLLLAAGDHAWEGGLDP